MIWRPTEDTRKNIPYRRFIANYDSKRDYLSEDPHPVDQDEEPYLVLDGQQRLQSLYLSFFGSFDGARVYLRMDHIPTEDVGDTDYIFEFLTNEEAKIRPEMTQLSEIIKLDADTKFEFIEGLAFRLTQQISNEKERQSSLNKTKASISRNIDRFNVKYSILIQEIEKRQNYDHVLEIFERVNSGGMVLSKSDLLFSTTKLKIKEMEKKFSDCLEFLNQGDRHNFNTDFLIKACLVIFGQGAKYEVKKLRDETFIKILGESFEKLNICIRQLLAWLDDVALIKCGRFLRSTLSLIPILDYMMISQNQDKPDGENGKAMRQYLYMSFFLRLFSRAADSVLDQIHNRLPEESKKDSKHFPIPMLREFIVKRQKVPFQIDDSKYSEDADLILNIVDGGVLQIDPYDLKRHPKDLKLEVDHIFPRTPLTDMGLGDVLNHIGNYRLIVMPANRRKSAKMPDNDTDFFGRKSAEIEESYHRALKEINRETFLAFRNARADLIRKHVNNFLGLN
jgi:hypothetical protein